VRPDRKSAVGWLIARALAATAAIAGAAAAPAGSDTAPWKSGDPIPSLREAFRGELRIGAAVGAGLLQSADTRAFLERQLDVVTPETELKPLALAPREGQYDFAPADAIVDWANQHGLKVRGHCLVWHEHEPAWMFTQDGKPVSRDVLAQRLRVYIHDVVGHFKGRIWAWDVVNEAFTAGSPGAERTNGWRPSGWYDVLGPEYVALAFQLAHEADPGALLFYNDYETENPAKRAKILELIRSLRDRGIAIHGIGHQAHYTLAYPDPAEVEATLRAVAAAGLRNQITELDITLRERAGSPMPPVTPELEARQARRWADVFRMYRRNADVIDAVVLWGVNDEMSWLQPPDRPLLFDHFQPTPPFWAVLGEAKRKPRRQPRRGRGANHQLHPTPPSPTSHAAQRTAGSESAPTVGAGAQPT
jgi:endo-1,4-beta-xylanase